MRRIFRHVVAIAALLATAGAHAQGTASGLEAALATALARHPALTGKQAQVQASASLGEAARSQRYPTLSAQVQQYGSAGVGGSGATSSNPTSLRA
ncbi:MAG: hypothetical protein EOO24_14715, partial [Comamonadaceae bacterium]